MSVDNVPFQVDETVDNLTQTHAARPRQDGKQTQRAWEDLGRSVEKYVAFLKEGGQIADSKLTPDGETQPYVGYILDFWMVGSDEQHQVTFGINPDGTHIACMGTRGHRESSGVLTDKN
ncbi:MAG: hypothetical protein AB1646_10725 [Thermodesulfobacteriota bacterium]